MSVPLFTRRIVAPKLTTDFRNGTFIEKIPVPEPTNNEIVIKTKYLGINASDINFIAGKYLIGQPPPFYPGFEAVGEVVAIGNEVTKFRVGDAVAATGYEMFTEYRVLDSKKAIKIPAAVPQVIPLLVGGLTASIALDELGQLKSGETILVTAAAGGTGNWAVQLAKLAGAHVIGTCSTDDKIQFLRELGCDRPINYKKEDLSQILKKEYPKGIDVVFESVGGDIFETCVNNLALKGRLIIVGMVSGYKDQSAWSSNVRESSLTARLLSRSASLRGFFLNHYWSDASTY